MACLACAQLPAITSSLNQSLVEQEAITSAIGTNPSFQNIIPQNEFIVDIKRLSRRVDTTQPALVRYLIETVVPRIIEPFLTNVDMEAFETRRPHIHKRHQKTVSYEALLSVTPNPSIGPPIVVVESIVPLQSPQQCCQITTIDEDIEQTQEEFLQEIL